ncbi:hypothetical protein TNCV_4073211 [Trichonephila clavipes]|uniref:Uncharacterized protein n=1 Tax=Trichonephila clavipes TaxID=2585209 RepID=A0A8X6W7Y6_TRICX|nr:hypothetical protein TNCV_4073211 [Trichonephila clavipes]
MASIVVRYVLQEKLLLFLVRSMRPRGEKSRDRSGVGSDECVRVRGGFRELDEGGIGKVRVDSQRCLSSVRGAYLKFRLKDLGFCCFVLEIQTSRF